LIGLFQTTWRRGIISLKMNRMKHKKLQRVLLSVFGLIAIIAISSGCGSANPGTVETNQNTVPSTSQPNALAVQSRIVIAEMFTGDW